ncbi:M1 family metallopeptidase [Nocardioides sp.]|uniref:M1 family metallopeptidase n=1 Tax=Nocardioides sp. TaxID=35761 RepID=UPI003784B3F7
MRYAAALVAGALLLAGCTSDRPGAAPSADPSASADRVAEGYSTPVEDAVYPKVGDPGVDALHYWLTLDWDPGTRTLRGVERLRLRSTADADELRLDLAQPLRPTAVTLDGERAAYRHEGKDLVVQQAVTEDSEHTLVLRYSGRPRQVPAPVQRSDFSRTGWTVTPSGEVWTMQEPYGAFTWYAVNDQPSDKALYDVTVSAPAPMVGVSNGQLLSRRVRAGETTTHWRLDEPASSYLVTVAIGDFAMARDRSPSGVPITYWTPRDRPDLARRLHAAPAGMAWLEDRLGPFPFDRLGFLVVDSQSGMETQTMITLGDTRYATSPEVLVHEMAHHWYGDEVTPVDWRDVWMNEGMATFLQGTWMSEHGGPPADQLFGEWASYDAGLRDQAGPPAAYHPDSFGSGNVYYIPAVMWEELRQKLGDETFWRLVREWPTVHADGNADYEDITSWWSEQSGQDLRGFFDTWLRSADSPPV